MTPGKPVSFCKIQYSLFYWVKVSQRQKKNTNPGGRRLHKIDKKTKSKSLYNTGVDTYSHQSMVKIVKERVCCFGAARFLPLKPVVKLPNTSCNFCIWYHSSLNRRILTLCRQGWKSDCFWSIYLRDFICNTTFYKSTTWRTLALATTGKIWQN